MIYSTPYDLRSVLYAPLPAVAFCSLLCVLLPAAALCSRLCKYGFPVVHSALCHMIYSTPYDLRSVLCAPLPAVRSAPGCALCFRLCVLLPAVVLCFRLCVLFPAVRPAP